LSPTKADQKTERESTLANKMEGTTTELISTRSTLRPQFIYACKCRTNQLLRMNLLSEEHSCYLPSYNFKIACRVSELPGGSLLITGGTRRSISEREVEKIDTLRECAVSYQAPMHTARCEHAAVYHTQYLYVLGGYCDRYLSECERYVCAESRWEVLPAMPVACCSMSAVVLDDSLYTLGGRAYEGNLDTVQKLSLDCLTWELTQLKLPQATRQFPCFKTDTQVYLVIEKTLYSFTPLQVMAVKTLVQGACECYSSYYSSGTLYYALSSGHIRSLAVGELTSL
jgi:hypothetical protein